MTNTSNKPLLACLLFLFTLLNNTISINHFTHSSLSVDRSDNLWYHVKFSSSPWVYYIVCSYNLLSNNYARLFSSASLARMPWLSSSYVTSTLNKSRPTTPHCRQSIMFTVHRKVHSWRLCVDYCRLNAANQKDAYPRLKFTIVWTHH